MKVRIEVTADRRFGTNSYLVEDEDTHDAVVIDSNLEPDLVIDLARRQGSVVRAILLTHTDLDHIAGLGELREAFGPVPIAVHEAERAVVADGKPVGWCNYGETTHLNGVMHRFGLNASEQQGVGSLACFNIAAPYRKHGVASALLGVALERLRARGLKVVEAYPARNHDSPQANYRGPLQMFLRAGFEPYRETERHIIVRKNL